MLKNKFLLVVLFVSALVYSCGVENGLTSAESAGSGVQSGSFANMLTVGQFLYIVSDESLITMDIAQADQPKEIDRQELTFGIESLFHRSGVLFVGSVESMRIFQINEQGIPEFRSETPYTMFENIVPCDPIVANDTLAIASLSSLETPDAFCGRALINELRFFDITDIENPILFNSIPMDEPKGIGLDDNLLFICEANDGFKVYDIQDGLAPEMLYHFPNIRTFDVIPTGNLALVVGPEDLFEFDYSDVNDIKFLSSLKL